MPKLSEQEQQEVNGHIEADKPPEKLRFLLFEDKREVKLVWSSETNEVCNIVLPFQVIEQVDEPRAKTQNLKPHRGFRLPVRFTQEARNPVWVSQMFPSKPPRSDSPKSET